MAQELSAAEGMGLVAATALTTLAGFVDANGYLRLGGFFVSFMSGNSTKLGVDLSQGRWLEAGRAGLIIALFSAAVVAGGLLAETLGRRRRHLILFVEAALLAIGSLLTRFGEGGLGVSAMIIAMGLQNAVFEKHGSPRVGLTYITGALVTMGQRLALALRGGSRLAWAPGLLLWAGLSAGATLGALSYRWFGPGGLWIGAGAALAIGLLLWAAERRRGVADLAL